MKLEYKSNDEIAQTLIQKDPKLAVVFNQTESITLTLEEDYFKALLSMIIAQQLSSRVAEVITNRVLVYFDNNPTPTNILETKDEDLRPLGLSYSKIKYLKSLAEHFYQGLIDEKSLRYLNDEAIIEQLTRIKGIGRWTAEMFLIFVMGRENVFSVLDLGLRRTVQAIYGSDLTHDEIIALSKQWEPYKSIVSHFLWHYHDNK